ncbi:hypothetical protein C8J57DRAFT_1499288 [Mycena rebaudengoi]|nr:hypothetical protein C8J57DRAFT_1499288 [Mycena rebaudengoi]
MHRRHLISLCVHCLHLATPSSSSHADRENPGVTFVELRTFGANATFFVLPFESTIACPECAMEAKLVLLWLSSLCLGGSSVAGARPTFPIPVVPASRDVAIARPRSRSCCQATRNTVRTTVLMVAAHASLFRRGAGSRAHRVERARALIEYGDARTFHLFSPYLICAFFASRVSHTSQRRVAVSRRHVWIWTGIGTVTGKMLRARG